VGGRAELSEAHLVAPLPFDVAVAIQQVGTIEVQAIL